MTSPLITLDRQAARLVLDAMASALPADWSQPGARDAAGPVLSRLRASGCLVLPGIVSRLALSPETGDDFAQLADGYRWRVEFTAGPWPDKLVSGWRNARHLGGGHGGADGALHVADEAVNAANRLVAFVSQDFTGDAPDLSSAGPLGRRGPAERPAPAARSPQPGFPHARRHPGQ